MTQTDAALLLEDDQRPTRVRVVGGGEVAASLGQLARVLHWDCTIVERVEDHEDLASTDALIVLSHDLEIACPALCRGLAAHLPYVGAMGSQTTQRHRRQWLMGHRISPELIDQVRGPAGLDIGADGPAEIALSIMAEVAAVRTGSRGGSISGRGRPVDHESAECPGG